ncbi:MAG: site-2 protease family protein [Elusimicrobiota bacterium]|jgi:regulator of sigma E protease|nr:site-2 protease family protein [Elusimicrobiota bacterium]
MTIILQILGIAFGLSFLIFIHELGHFTVAKLCGVRILTFAFGFGPDLVKVIHKGTKYCIKLFPFGGMVAMAGEDPDSATGDKGEFLSLPWYKKIFIAFAGPFSNYILAAILFAMIFSLWGVSQVSPLPQIGGVVDQQAAQQAGLVPNDIIKSINGKSVNTWADIAETLEDKADKNTVFVIERGTYSFNVNVNVGKNPVTNLGIIGIYPKVIKQNISIFKSIEYGARSAIVQTTLTISYLADKIVTFEKPDISGPVGIMQVMAKATKDGLENYLTLIAIISVALGLFNLFPLPFVDGGMIVLFFVEGIRQKRIGLKVIQTYNTIGIIIIGMIFVFATYNDLIRLGIGNFFK